jgi:hypothetical protein
MGAVSWPLPLFARRTALPKSKPITLPTVHTLPNGELDCDPDPDPGGFLAELQDGAVSRARRLVNTPGNVLQRERQREEELEHERAKAAIWSQPSAVRKPKAPRLTGVIRSARNASAPGRRKSSHTLELEKALLVNGRLPSKLHTLNDWLIILNSKNPPVMFDVPDSSPPHSIPYPDAWKVSKYQNMIRKRLKRVLQDKLLPA